MGPIKFGSHEATLKAMNSQRLHGTLCDLKIRVEEGYVSAHKAVLATCTQYFHSMFTGGFREGDQPMSEIDMSEVFPDLATAEHVIQSMYTGQIDVTPNNVCSMYSVCSFLLYDKPKQLCEDFMTKNLSLETAIEYWEAAHENTSGDLYSSATNLIKNRFHDHFIYQEALLDVPVSTLSGLLKTGVSRFCTPRQILTFLLKWSLRSDQIDNGILKNLVTETDLPGISSLHAVRVLHDVCSEEPMKTADSQRIQDLRAEVFAALHYETSWQDHIHEIEETSTCTHGRKRHLNANLELEEVGRFGKLLKKERDRSLEKDFEQPTDREMNLEKNLSNLDVEQPCKQCSTIDESERPQHVFTRHITGNLPESEGKLDVILTISPSLTGLQENSHDYRQLRLCAYVPQSQLWVDLGITDYPMNDYDHKRIEVSESRLYAVNENIYMSTGREIFVMHLPSRVWKRVRLPSEYLERMIFPSCIKNILYLLIIHDVEGNSKVLKRQSKEELSVNGRFLFGKMTENGLWEEILCYRDARNAAYGPCWAENSCFLIQKSRTTRRHSYEYEGSGVLCFDPQSKDVRFVPFVAERDVRDKIGNLFFEQETLSLVELDSWVYLWWMPRAYMTSTCSSVAVRYQTINEKHSGLLEEQCITFPDNSSDKIPPVSWLHGESPNSHVYTTTGSSLWRFINSSKERSVLEELNFRKPDVVRQHTPPPCNVILTATGARLDRTFFANKPPALYRQVHFPSPRVCHHSDSSDSDDLSDLNDICG